MLFNTKAYVICGFVNTVELKNWKLVSGLVAESLPSDITDVCHSCEVCNKTTVICIWTDFLIPQWRRTVLIERCDHGTFEQACICNELTAFEKNKGAFGKNAAAFACVCVHTLVRSPLFPVECTAFETNAFAFALHLYRFSHGQSQLMNHLCCGRCTF